MTTTLAAGRAGGERSAARPGPGDRAGGDDPAARPHARIGPAVRARGPDLPFGVVSSFQKMQPYPIYVSHGPGQPRLGPGRQRVPRLPLRFRRDGGGARASADRRGDRTRRRAAGPISRSPPSRRWPSARRSAGGSTSRCCGSPIRAPRPRWTRSGWPGRPPGGTWSARSRARITGTTTAVMFSIVPNADLMGGRDRPGQRAGVQGHGEGRRQVHRGRAVQRRRPPRAAARRARVTRSPASSWSPP